MKLDHERSNKMVLNVNFIDFTSLWLQSRSLQNMILKIMKNFLILLRSDARRFFHWNSTGIPEIEGHSNIAAFWGLKGVCTQTPLQYWKMPLCREARNSITAGRLYHRGFSSKRGVCDFTFGEIAYGSKFFLVEFLRNSTTQKVHKLRVFEPVAR